MSISKDEIQQLARDGNLVKAVEEARKFVEDHPDDPEAKVMLGRYHFLQKDYEEALDILMQASEQDPESDDIAFFTAITLDQLEEYEEAIKYYRKISQSADYGSIANFYMGKIYTNYRTDKLRDPRQARRCFLNAATGDKPIEEAFFELAALERDRRAVYVLQNGLKVFPKSVLLHTQLARHYVLRLNEYAQCIELVDQALENGIDADDLKFYSALAHFRLGEYDGARNLVGELGESDVSLQRDLTCVDAMLSIECGHYDEAETLLSQVISADFQNKLRFGAHFLSMCCALRQDDVSKAEVLFDEIPEHESVDFFSFGDLSLNLFPMEDYFLEALGGIIEKSCDTQATAKAHGLRAIYLHFFADPDWQTIEEDASEALAYYPDCSKYHFLVGEVYRNSKKPKEAILHYVQEQMYLGDSADSEFYDYESLLAEIYKDEDLFCELLDQVDEILSGPAGSYWMAKDRLAAHLLEPWVRFLHSESDYARVVRICEWFSYEQSVGTGVLFELAYAYNEIGKKRKSISFYETYLRDVGDSSAVRNNLGLLYQDEGALEKAEESFQKAIELNPENEKASRNLQRVRDMLRQAERQQKVYERAAHLYSQEKKAVRRAIAKLYETRIEDGLILCSPEGFALLLKIQPSHADERIEDYVDKKYFDEVGDSGLVFDGYILRLNPGLTPQVEDELSEMEKEEYIEQLVFEMTPENLEQKYGYNQSLIARLAVLDSPELVGLLERDLREAVTALATQSHKSALVLCGSIVEAVLVDRLLARETSALQSFERLRREGRTQERRNQVRQWSLNTLLDVAREENLVSLNLYHWGHGLRGFRNLVHPAVEQRREMEVSRENAEVAWSVVKRLLKEMS